MNGVGLVSGPDPAPGDESSFSQGSLHVRKCGGRMHGSALLVMALEAAVVNAASAPLLLCLSPGH